MIKKTSSPWLTLFIIFLVYSLFITFCCFSLLYSTPSLTSSDLSASYEKGYTDGHNEGYSSGYAAGKEDGIRTGENAGYETGYDAGYNDAQNISSDKTDYTSSDPLLPTLILPGTIVHSPKYQCTCPFTVELPDDDHLYYIYLEYVKPSLSSDFAMDQRDLLSSASTYVSNLPNDLSGDDISYITRSGSFDSFDVPPGVYRLWYCSGPYWYDLGNYFGEDTVWYTSDDLLSFYETYTDYVGNTVTLYKITGGNFSTYQTTEVPF